MPRGLHPEPLRPDAEWTPDEGVEGQNDRGQDADTECDASRVACDARIRDERAKSGSGIRAPEGGEGLARDQEKPAVAPGEDRVVHQLRDRGRQRQQAESEHAPEAEARRCGLEVHRNRRQGFVDSKCHVPGHARENEEDHREFDSDRAPLKRDDKEHERGWEEAEDRDGLEDVEDREHDDGGLLVRRRGGPVGDREDQGQQVCEDHPRRREQRVEGKLDRVERRLRIENRNRDRREDHDTREDPEPPAEAAHLARKGRGLYTGCREAFTRWRGGARGSPSAHVDGSPLGRGRSTEGRPSRRP